MVIFNILELGFRKDFKQLFIKFLITIYIT